MNQPSPEFIQEVLACINPNRPAFKVHEALKSMIHEYNQTNKSQDNLDVQSLWSKWNQPQSSITLLQPQVPTNQELPPPPGTLLQYAQQDNPSKYHNAIKTHEIQLKYLLTSEHARLMYKHNYPTSLLLIIKQVITPLNTTYNALIYNHTTNHPLAQLQLYKDFSEIIIKHLNKHLTVAFYTTPSSASTRYVIKLDHSNSADPLSFTDYNTFKQFLAPYKITHCTEPPQHESLCEMWHQNLERDLEIIPLPVKQFKTLTSPLVTSTAISKFSSTSNQHLDDKSTTIPPTKAHPESPAPTKPIPSIVKSPTQSSVSPKQPSKKQAPEDSPILKWWNHCVQSKRMFKAEAWSTEPVSKAAVYHAYCVYTNLTPKSGQIGPFWKTLKEIAKIEDAGRINVGDKRMSMVRLPPIQDMSHDTAIDNEVKQKE